MVGSSPSSSVDGKVEWWRSSPSEARLQRLLSSFLSASLEILKRCSTCRTAATILFIDITDYDVDSQILSTYLLAFVILVPGMLYTSLDFAIFNSVPLAALRRGNVSEKRSAMSGSVGGLPPFAFFHSLRSRHSAQCLTIIAALVSS